MKKFILFGCIGILFFTNCRAQKENLVNTNEKIKTPTLSFLYLKLMPVENYKMFDMCIREYRKKIIDNIGNDYFVNDTILFVEFGGCMPPPPYVCLVYLSNKNIMYQCTFDNNDKLRISNVDSSDTEFLRAILNKNLTNYIKENTNRCQTSFKYSLFYKVNDAYDFWSKTAIIGKNECSY